MYKVHINNIYILKIVVKLYQVILTRGYIHMKTSKKIISVILILTMLFSFPLTSYAADDGAATDKGIFYKCVMDVLDFAAEKLIGLIGEFFPTPSSWEKTDALNTDGLMTGTEEFLSESAENARFSLGYDSRSLIEGFDVIGKEYVTGSIAFKKKLATSVEDDLKVRTVAISDGSKRGISLFLVLDAYGLSLTDVREIRSRLSSFISEKNINSVTVSVLHQHSAVDTFGMNGDIFNMALVNPFRVLFGIKMKNGKDTKYMENLFEKCVLSAKSAVENMTPGALYYGTADQTPYLRDKRAPYVCDANFNRFRFVPDNGEKETWLVSTEVHCVGNGVSGTIITGDYPYYAEKVINETADANVFFYMGAQQATTDKRTAESVDGYNEDMSDLEMMKGFGTSIGKAITGIKDEKEVSPLLNITYRQVEFSVENPILILGGKVGMFEDKIIKTEDGKIKAITEVGYMEIGDEFAFAIVPGELAPEIAYGGALQEAGSWSGKDWSYPSLQQIIIEKGKNRKLMVLDLANDQLSYIIPGNNFIPFFLEESWSLELVSLGAHFGAEFIEAFSETVR